MNVAIVFHSCPLRSYWSAFYIRLDLHFPRDVGVGLWRVAHGLSWAPAIVTLVVVVAAAVVVVRFRTELAILLARIGSLLRRSNWARQRAPKEARPEPQHDRFTFNGKTIDFDTLELTVGDRVLQLTLMEANLLRYLVDHEGKAVSRKAMLEQVWGLHEDTDTRAIDNFIVRLRRYIEKEPGKPKHLLKLLHSGPCVRRRIGSEDSL